MISAICLFLPALVMNVMRGKLIVPNRGLKREIIDYALEVLAINYIMMTILTAFGEHRENVTDQMNQYIVFSWKYLSCAFVIVVAELFLEKFVRQKLQISITLKKCNIPKKCWKYALWIYTAILFGLNAIRVFDQNFWGDEAYTVIILRRNLWDMIDMIAKIDSHPPLYYVICKFISSIAGTSGIVYHTISLIPYAVILVVSLTLICKWFGPHASVILITLTSLLPSAITYNVEVRMYSWGALFILLSYLGLYQILKDGKCKDYVLFTVFSLASAYTHYYCLLSVAFFYLILICDAFVCKTKKKIISTALLCIGAILGYLPWLGFLLTGIRRHINGFWATEIPSIATCMEYIFDTKYGIILLVMLFLMATIKILYESGILQLENETKFLICINLKNLHFTTGCAWILAGFICIFGTIVTGIVVSAIFRPLLVIRYIYPVLIIAWLILAVCISSMKWRSIYTVAVVLCILVSTIPEYTNTYVYEKASNESLKETLDATKNIIGQEDIILTNHVFIHITVSECYYPGVKCQMLDETLEINSQRKYWLIVDENLESMLMQKEMNLEDGFEIITSGNLGMIPVWIYQITDTKQAEHILKDMMSTG